MIENMFMHYKMDNDGQQIAMTSRFPQSNLNVLQLFKTINIYTVIRIFNYLNFDEN